MPKCPNCGVHQYGNETVCSCGARLPKPARLVPTAEQRDERRNRIANNLESAGQFLQQLGAVIMWAVLVGVLLVAFKICGVF